MVAIVPEVEPQQLQLIDCLLLLLRVGPMIDCLVLLVCLVFVVVVVAGKWIDVGLLQLLLRLFPLLLVGNLVEY